MTTKTTAQKSALSDATEFEPVTEESFSDSPKKARVRKATVKAVTAGKPDAVPRGQPTQGRGLDIAESRGVSSAW
jgi:hypothetical protein